MTTLLLLMFYACLFAMMACLQAMRSLILLYRIAQASARIACQEVANTFARSFERPRRVNQAHFNVAPLTTRAGGRD